MKAIFGLSRRRLKQDNLKPLYLFGVRNYVLARPKREEPEEKEGGRDWEPDGEYLDTLGLNDRGVPYTLKLLMRHDVHEAREFFVNVLLPIYSQEPMMYNKWAVMEWKAGDPDTARKIFKRASKIIYSTELWSSWASMELQLKKFSESEKLYNTILSVVPDNPFALLGMLLIAGQRGQTEGLSVKFEELHSRHPEDIAVLHAYAVHEGKMHNVSASRELFGKCTTFHDEGEELSNHLVWQSWAFMERANGNFDFAFEIVTKGIEIHGMNFQLLTIAAMIEYDRGNVDSARELYQGVVKGPYTPTAAIYTSYANLEEKEGNVKLAITLYQECLEMYPTHSAAIMSLAHAHDKMGYPHLARKTFSYGADSTKRHHLVLSSWADFERKGHCYEQARELYKEVSSNHPDYFLPLQRWAEMESLLDHADEARILLNEAQVRFGSTIKVLLVRGFIEEENKKYRAARTLYDLAVKKDKTNGESWNRRALLELRVGDYKRGRNLLTIAFRNIPHHENKTWSILLCTYGRLFASEGNYEQAESAFQRALELEPTNPITHTYLAKNVYDMTGNLSKAVEHYELAIACSKLSKTHGLQLELDTMVKNSKLGCIKAPKEKKGKCKFI